MNKELNLTQAKILMDYLEDSSGKEASNVEVLSGLILCFCHMYLKMIIVEMQKQ